MGQESMPACTATLRTWLNARMPESNKNIVQNVWVQEIARLAESESGMDSPRADSELDLGVSDFSTPELLQVQQQRNPTMSSMQTLSCWRPV